MIRKFHKSDLNNIKCNQFSTTEGDAEDILHADYYKNTLVDGADVLCIIAFRRYWERNFIAFMMVSDDIRPVHARELKEYIRLAMIDFECERLQTSSIKCETLDRWHRFLGFELEGTQRKLIFGKDFNMWAMFPPGA